MRVLHILRATGVAGAERHLLALLEGLRSADCDARLGLLTKKGRPLPGFESQLRDSRIPFRTLPMNGHVDFTLLARLRALARETAPQVVHTHLFHADLYGALAARLERVPTLVSSRHNDNAFRRRQPWRALNSRHWRVVDAGIAISQAVADFVVEVEGAPRDKLRVIHYGLKPTTPLDPQGRRQLRRELGLDDTQPVIAMACRLVEQKGVSDALQAFAGTRAQFPQARLLIAGEGPLRARLQDEAVQAGLTGSVRFAGWHEDVPRLLGACDVFLMPSLWEGFGLVLLEAMSQGLPVVASRVSAIPEVVLDGETGLLAPARDVPAFRDALLCLLRDPVTARRMGERGRHRLETCFAFERMVQDTSALYRELQPSP